MPDQISLNDWLTSPRAGHGLHISAGSGEFSYHPYSDIAAEALHTAQRVLAAGVRPGSVVVLAVADPLQFVTAFFGVLAAGCTPSPLATPATFGGGERSLEHAATIIRVSGCTAVVFDDLLAQHARDAAEHVGPAPLLVPSRDSGAGAGTAVPLPLPELALLQYTSGSSGAPKGVRVSVGNLVSTIAAQRDWLGLTPDDVFAQWVPLYHDMGLITTVHNMVTQNTMYLMTPQDFLRDPMCWLRLLGQGLATATSAPSFGFAYAARRVRAEHLDGLDFSRWRVAILGAERIDPAGMGRFGRLLAPFGFDPSALVAAYGMAEATLAVTGVTPGTGTSIRAVDSPVITEGTPVKFGDAGVLGVDLPVTGTWLTGCGTAVPGMSVDIIDDQGAELGEGYLGQIRIRGSSVAQGYQGDVAPGRFTADGFETGDAGVLLGGDLFVVGRIGDSLKVRGTAVHAEDLELEIAAELGVSPNRVVVLLGTADLVDLAVVILAGGDRDADPRPIVTLLRARTSESVAHAIVRGGPNAIERTSSGKPRRRVLWRSMLEGELPGEVVHSTWDDVSTRPAPWAPEARSEHGGAR
ncbi:AMP-binding protein [Lentzea californiensis]|uniref:AMP-binding protein n=1 Tax=Lentzea californiensis TaxID=438851 RepID=UPI0021654214|nr:AMP-binding protein [Lentzea californiensis]MCR3752114.1 Acyl-CoA synthetase (AMP-forming)/AMP-acid ligase II [Lentzea californiensis]